MNIKDPEVHRLAHLLAARRHTTATGAVREALTEALERERADRVGIARRLLAIAKRAERSGEPYRSDEDLYDERGLPH